MNIVVIYSLIIYLILRIIGFLVSLDFYYSTKSKKFVIFSLAWLMFILANMCPIFADILKIKTLVDLLLLFNVIFASIASLLIMYGLFLYFREISPRIIYISIGALPITPLILYFSVGVTFATQFAILYLNLIYFISIVGPMIWYKSFKKNVGKSIRWYYALLISFSFYIPVSIVILAQGNSYGLYEVQDETLIILNYVPPWISMLLIVIFLIHIEYNNNKIMKNKLKDQYSHDLGNILQAISGAADVIKIDGVANERDLEMYELLKEKCKEAAILIKDIRKLL